MTTPTNPSAEVFCAHCGTKNTRGIYACSRCGERIVEITSDTHSPLGLVSCSHCGNANEARAVYCWVCGEEMNDAVRISPTPTVVEREPQQVEQQSHTRMAEPEPPVLDKTPADPQPSAEHNGLEYSKFDPTASPGADPQIENTSGLKDGAIPAGVRGWNWAAFLLAPMWGIFSGVPYTVILFGAFLLPPALQFSLVAAASVFLGFKGNELAWRGRKWRSVEHFREFQSKWTSWSIRITILFGLIFLYLAMTSGNS